MQDDGKTSCGRHRDSEAVALSAVDGIDTIGVGICLPIGVSGVAEDGSGVGGVRLQEREFDGQFSRVLVGDTAHIPIIGMAVLASKDAVVAYLSVEQDRLLPVAGHLLYESEGVGVLHVMLGQVACHLQGGVETDEECELVHERRLSRRYVRECR